MRLQDRFLADPELQPILAREKTADGLHTLRG
jgi:hypothetical protein